MSIQLIIDSVDVGNLKYGESDQPFLKGRLIPNHRFERYKQIFEELDRFINDSSNLYQQQVDLRAKIESLKIQSLRDRESYKELNGTQFTICEDLSFFHRLPQDQTIIEMCYEFQANEWVVNIETDNNNESRYKVLISGREKYIELVIQDQDGIEALGLLGNDKEIALGRFRSLDNHRDHKDINGKIIVFFTYNEEEIEIICDSDHGI